MDRVNAIQHLEALRKDARDEIKMRIEQRDKYSIQFTIALASIVAVSFHNTGFGKVLIVAPLFSIYFTWLILYSYIIHTVIAFYLRSKIEPELAKLCGTSPDLEWETFYKTLYVPGIRRKFFQITLWVVSATSLLYLWLAERDKAWFISVLLAVTIFYILTIIMISIMLKKFNDKINKKKEQMKTNC